MCNTVCVTSAVKNCMKVHIYFRLLASLVVQGTDVSLKCHNVLFSEGSAAFAESSFLLFCLLLTFDRLIFTQNTLLF